LTDPKLSKCPMCGKARNPSDESCSYCGYIFEDNLGSQVTAFGGDHDVNAGSNQNETVTETVAGGVSFDRSTEFPLKTMDGIICKNSRSVQEGSLILTNWRLAFAQNESIGQDSDVQKILQKRDLLSIPLDQIANVSGNRGIIRPSLRVVWHNPPGDPTSTKTEFTQKNGPRSMEEARNGVNEWVPLIEKAAVSDEVEPLELNNVAETAADESELKSRVLEELGDMQWKGFFQIEKDIGEKYGGSINPDVLEAACSKLVKENLIEQDKYGHFFKKIQAGAGKS